MHGHPDGWIEIAYARPGEPLNKSRIFPAHDLKEIIDFVTKVNAAGFNVYIGAALRQGNRPLSGRANKSHFAAARYAWIEYDAAGDHERVVAICKAQRIEPALMVVTGNTPYKRCHLYFQLADAISNSDELKITNAALKELFGSDHVDDPARVLRVGGTVNYASPAKVARGYVTEVTTVHANRRPGIYSVEALCALRPRRTELDYFLAYGEAHLPKRGRNADELLALLDASREPHQWWNSIRSATASMVGKGWPEQAVMFACAPYAAGGIYDKDVQKLYDDAVAKFGKKLEVQS
ncbi:hypothetical protein [Bradyrhizobium manausense]|uniref:hypothetical protein n=1 Tax=Bradyrhizobium manausense TaxID=989370 RepID=UPI0012EE7EA8|nr:hypothetical protein [Bradyrhizobium manausense]